MKLLRCLLLLSTFLALQQQSLLAVPHVISYQGRIGSGDGVFTGTGWFKFALVDGGQEQTMQHNETVSELSCANALEGGGRNCFRNTNDTFKRSRHPWIYCNWVL